MNDTLKACFSRQPNKLECYHGSQQLTKQNVYYGANAEEFVCPTRHQLCGGISGGLVEEFEKFCENVRL
jgi:hypothetical protein